MSDQPHPWHALSGAEAQQRLATPPGGLGTAEIERRRRQHGPNRLAPPRRRGPLQRLLLQFHNVLLYVMMAAALVTALLGHWVDTGVLLAAVVINALIGFIQEGKAENALDAIRAMLSPRATVIRDGRRMEIDAAELVPGDLVLLASGDRVPADLRLLQCKELRVEEAALTGESLPVEKDTAGSAPPTRRSATATAWPIPAPWWSTARPPAWWWPPAPPPSWAASTICWPACARWPRRCCARSTASAAPLAIAILGIGALTFILGTLWRGHAPEEMFMMVVALVASAIPEGLPAIMTVTLALGVQRMARRQAIVRRLPAVETLGSVTVICSDKTGTLTRNEMTVQRVVCAGHVFDVGGVGYAPVGSLSVDGRHVEVGRYPALELAIRRRRAVQRRTYARRGRCLACRGRPHRGRPAGAGATRPGDSSTTSCAAAWPRLDSIPFESQHRFMATHHRDPQGQDWLLVKGAPGARPGHVRPTSVGHSSHEQPLDPDYWRRMATDTAAQGLRLLALACKRAAPAGASLHMDDMQGGFTLLGLVGIIDPPREEAIAAVAECHRAGIRVKMITGDHAETARAIGAQLAIGVGKPA